MTASVQCLTCSKVFEIKMVDKQTFDEGDITRGAESGEICSHFNDGHFYEIQEIEYDG